MAETNSNANFPLMSNDPTDRLTSLIRRLDPNWQFKELLQITDYPVASEWELLTHYLRGAAGPPVDLKLYVDIGVGFKLKPKGFPNTERGEAAKDLVLEEMKKRNFENTLLQDGAFQEVIGRSCIIKTFDKDGGLYYNKQEKVSGYDAINPMTLDDNQLKKFLNDTTGTAYLEQKGLVPEVENSKFSNNRVIFNSKNVFTNYSPYGWSDLQRCIVDLRTMARFPHYRESMGRKYANLFRVVTIDLQAMGDAGIEEVEKIRRDPRYAQRYLDDVAEFYREQELKGNLVAIYNYEKIDQVTFGGKEPGIQEIERSTIDKICYELEVPMPLLMFAEIVNRATLETLNDTFINQREKGSRNKFYTPIINEFIKDVLNYAGYTDGTLEVVYNPFISSNMKEASEIINNIYPTGAMQNPQIRDEFGLPGGEGWDEIEPIPAGTKLPTPTEATKDLQRGINNFYKEAAKKGLIKRM